jgi:hypothetical protein
MLPWKEMLFCRQSKEFWVELIKPTFLLQTFYKWSIWQRKQEGEENCTTRNVTIYAFHEIFLKQSSQMRWNTVRMGQTEIEYDIWWEIPKGRDHMGDKLYRWEQLKTLTKGLWRWYITYNYYNPVHRPSSCLLFKIQRLADCILPPYSGGAYSVGPIWRQVLALPIGSNWVVTTWRRRQNPVSETLCFKYKTGRWIISRIIIVKNKTAEIWIEFIWPRTERTGRWTRQWGIIRFSRRAPHPGAIRARQDKTVSSSMPCSFV